MNTREAFEFKKRQNIVKGYKPVLSKESARLLRKVDQCVEDLIVSQQSGFAGRVNKSRNAYQIAKRELEDHVANLEYEAETAHYEKES